MLRIVSVPLTSGMDKERLHNAKKMMTIDLSLQPSKLHGRIINQSVYLTFPRSSQYWHDLIFNWRRKDENWQYGDSIVYVKIARLTNLRNLSFRNVLRALNHCYQIIDRKAETRSKEMKVCFSINSPGPKMHTWGLCLSFKITTKLGHVTVRRYSSERLFSLAIEDRKIFRESSGV